MTEKNARVSPIYREGSKQIIGNYRPISILPIVSKVFEREIFQQLYRYLNVNDLLLKFLSGFRPGHSSLTALIQMCDTWFTDMEKGMLTGVIFLDISKAFRSVNHDILLEKRTYYGVCEVEL